MCMPCFCNSWLLVENARSPGHADYWLALVWVDLYGTAWINYQITNVYADGDRNPSPIKLQQLGPGFRFTIV